MIATIRNSALIRAVALLLILAPSALARGRFSTAARISTATSTPISTASETLVSASPAHLTFSSMPPGNGFAIGGVCRAEQPLRLALRAAGRGPPFVR